MKVTSNIIKDYKNIDFISTTNNLFNYDYVPCPNCNMLMAMLKNIQQLLLEFFYIEYKIFQLIQSHLRNITEL